ncbi:MAG: DUF4263 domain-containing protein [Nanoarchaeota archaeon]|nr:DUF4263 domain-containing protein [Nanoarchaeota archaeon]
MDLFLIDSSDKTLKANISGFENGEINVEKFKLSIYSCNNEGKVTFNEDLDYNATKKLYDYINVFEKNTNEEELTTFMSQFTSIHEINTVKTFFQKLGTDKLNHIEKSLTNEELENLNASIKQTLYRKEIENLKKLISIDINSSSKNIFFQEIKKKEDLIKYLFDNYSNKETTQQEKVFENWIRKNLWVLEIEFFEDLKLKNLKKYIKGGKNVMPDLVFKNKNSFLNLIELKRPKEILFKEDKSHKTLYKHPNLSKAESQCIKYLRKIEEADRQKFESELHTEILRPSIKLIYGCFSKGNKKEQKQELRSINFHLNCINIITYNDLIDMGEKILESYE